MIYTNKRITVSFISLVLVCSIMPVYAGILTLNCHDMGCSNGLIIEANSNKPLLYGHYKLNLTSKNLSFECNAKITSSDKEPFCYKQQSKGNSIIQLYKYGRVIIHIENVAPKELSLKLFRNGELIWQETKLKPQYQPRYPNGKNCDIKPACINARIKTELGINLNN